MSDTVAQSYEGHPTAVKAVDLFPELSQDIDRRIAHAESRVKLWVIGGVLANILLLGGTGFGLVYQIGQMSQQAQQAFQTIAKSEIELKRRGFWMEDRILWESSAEQWMVSQGYQPPRYIRGRGLPGRESSE